MYRVPIESNMQFGNEKYKDMVEKTGIGQVYMDVSVLFHRCKRVHGTHLS